MELDIEQIMAAYDRKIAALTRQLVFAEAQMAALQARLAEMPEAHADRATEGA